MQHNGEINKRFGLYKNLCCGQEIIIREGAKFPDCKRHTKLTTIWKPVELADTDDAKKSRRRSA